MTKRGEHQADDAAADLKRMQDWSQQPGVDSRSTGDGVERNARLKKLDELNQHSSHPTERRRPGFPSQQGPLARRAEEQEETANEARARLLRPTIVRLAQEAAGFTPEPIRRSHWLGWFIVFCAVVLFYALAYHWLGPWVWVWVWEGRP